MMDAKFRDVEMTILEHLRGLITGITPLKFDQFTPSLYKFSHLKWSCFSLPVRVIWISLAWIFAQVGERVLILLEELVNREKRILEPSVDPGSSSCSATASERIPKTLIPRILPISISGRRKLEDKAVDILCLHHELSLLAGRNLALDQFVNLSYRSMKQK